MKAASFYIVSICALLVLASCSAGIRYSPDEIKEYPPSTQENIRSGIVVFGMTQPEVRYAWGTPSEINILKQGDEGNFVVEWVYKRAGLFSTRLIFTDGKVTEIISNEPVRRKFKAAE
jgi:hypothetical protein